MAFMLDCTNKGCGETQAPYLDKDTNKVYCSACNREIMNITIFTKNQMKSLKQFKVREKKPFAVKCNSCNTEDKPFLIKDKIVCSFCSKELTHLTESFVRMLKIQLKNKPDNE